MNPDRDTLLKVVKSNPQGMSIHKIHSVFGVNPQNEEDRRTVWKIGQTLAHLCRDGWMGMDTLDGHRHFSVPSAV